MNEELANADNLLEGIYNRQLINERKASKSFAYEEKIIKKILTKAGKVDQIAILANTAKIATGRPSVTFAGFNDLFPSFPVWIMARQLQYVFQITVTDIFNKFPSMPVIAAWEEVYEANQFPDKASVLVCDWPGVSGTQVVVHNHYTANVEDNVSRLSRTIGKGSKKIQVTIEQLEPFLDRILPMWT